MKKTFNSTFLSHFWRETVTPARQMLAISFVLFIFCISAQGQIASRPETGTVIRDINRNGEGLLIINNNWTMDTVAVLTDKRDKPRIAVYLRAKDSLEIDGIKDGEYIPYFSIGDGWNAAAGDFNAVYKYCRFPAMLFETDDNNYTIQEINLTQADATNFMPGQFEFPDISS